jgi:hypothetical protein
MYSLTIVNSPAKWKWPGKVMHYAAEKAETCQDDGRRVYFVRSPCQDIGSLHWGWNLGSAQDRVHGWHKVLRPRGGGVAHPIPLPRSSRAGAGPAWPVGGARPAGTRASPFRVGGGACTAGPPLGGGVGVQGGPGPRVSSSFPGLWWLWRVRGEYAGPLLRPRRDAQFLACGRWMGRLRAAARVRSRAGSGRAWGLRGPDAVGWRAGRGACGGPPRRGWGVHLGGGPRPRCGRGKAGEMF